MASIFSRYLSEVANKVKEQRHLHVIGAATIAKRHDIPANINQLCSPALVWDWDVNPIGQISYTQFQFSDSAPLSSKSDILFTSSGDSVSEAYRTFLHVLKANEKFPYQSLLSEVLQKNEPPDSYANGWTKVLMNGNLEWKPDWIFSESVYSWKQKVKAGTINNAGTIKVELRKKDDLSSIFTSDHGKEASLAFISQFETVEIHADAWGIISIRPGSWFSSSILKLGESYMPEGLNLLTARVAAFYVADNPKFTFKANNNIDINAIAKAENFKCFGVNTTLTEPLTNLLQENQITMQAKDFDPAIVGVVLERF